MVRTSRQAWYKMPVNHQLTLRKCIAERADLLPAVRKVFLSYPTAVLTDHPDIEFDIKNRVSTYFAVGFHCVQVAGSAKTGYSFYKEKEFRNGESDLDLAIIDMGLFVKYCELVSKITRNYTDLGQFGTTMSGMPHDKIMRESISNFGMFNFAFMPNCSDRGRVTEFLIGLNKPYSKLFKKITVAIYSSAYFFELKQKTSLEISPICTGK